MRHYVIGSILVILGLAAIAYKGTLPANDWAITYLTESSSALLVSGLLSLLLKIFNDKESETNLKRLLRIHDSVDDLGLMEIIPESQGYSFTKLIEDAGQLSIVMNDGLRWVGNNAVALTTRFSKVTTTDFFTVDPDSTFVESLAKKTSLNSDELSKKINDTWARVIDCYNHSDKKGSLRIYALKTYPTRSIFLSGNILVETPYQTASGRANIPVYVYRKVSHASSPHAFATHDISELRKESKLIYTSSNIYS